jgi:hypothetical protein
MQKFNTPTGEDLHAYSVLINFLQQVRSLLEDINGETERSIQLLREQKALLEEQDCAIQDLSSSLNDYAEDAGHRLGLFRDAEELPSAMVSSEVLAAQEAYRDIQCEEDKFEQTAEAVDGWDGDCEVNEDDPNTGGIGWG